MKYVIVTGGVTSSLGKGVVTAAIGRLLKAQGYSVLLQKFDPYLNVNPGTLSPAQHGEVFVTADGGETDLDLGHYERFCDINLTRKHDITTGQIYQSILDKEYRGEFSGSTVQVIPHVTDEIKSRLYHNDSEADIVVTEIGGTVGDIEGLPFLEAVRQVKNETGSDNIVYVHVTLVPTVISEVKTKPTQHSVKELRSIGIQPDILICRTNSYGFLTDDMKKKLSLFCNVDIKAIFENHNLATIYELPRILYEQGLDQVLLQKLDLPDRDSDLDIFTDIGFKIRCLAPGNKQIAIVGQYIDLPDAYISIVEALRHAFLAAGKTMGIKFVSTKEIEEWSDTDNVLSCYDGIIIADSLSSQGKEGRVKAAAWAKNRKVPCFGIDDGFFAMAASAVNNTDIAVTVPVKTKDICLGEYRLNLKNNTMAKDIYKAHEVSERYRHRQQLNSECYDIMLADGFVISGTSLTPDDNVAEIIEYKNHPWFIGCQFHPEFKSRPGKPHPLFVSFVSTIINRS